MEFYYHETDGDLLVISADGGLNGDTANQFVTEIERLVDAGLRKIIVDCTALNFVSSAGLAVLMRLHKHMKPLGGNVKIAHVKGTIMQVLEVTHLSKVFEIYPDVDRARLAFREG